MTPDLEDTPEQLNSPVDFSLNQQLEANKWSVLVAVGIGTFMSALDGSVVNTILPIVREHFSASVASIEWVVTIYLLVLSGVLLGFGRLGDIRGHKRIYMLGFVVFIISSAFCGFATSVAFLILFRGVQALGAAMLQANSPAILTSSFPGRQRGQALGLQATMTYLGLTIGPSLGGWITEHFTWRAVFYLNIPVGLAALYLSMKAIQADKKTTNHEGFDYAGAGLFILGLILLIFSLNQGHALGWSSLPILITIFLSFVLLFTFFQLEKRLANPMLDLQLFSRSKFTTSVVSAILNYIGVYSIIFLMPFYLISGLGLNPALSGLILTAMPIIMAITAPISGSISDKVGTKAPAALGMILLTLGLVLLSRLSLESNFSTIIGRLLVAGLGIGIFISPNTSALMGSAPRDRQGIASGILATSRNFGMVLGVGLAGAVFTSNLSTGDILPSNEVILAVQASFIVAAIVTACGIPVILLNRQKREAIQNGST